MGILQAETSTKPLQTARAQGITQLEKIRKGKQ